MPIFIVMILCLLLLLFLLCVPVELDAVPAQPKKMTFTQADGTILQVTLVGDEFCHYYLTSDNVPVVRGDDDVFYYVKTENGKFLNSGIMAHEKELRTESEQMLCNGEGKLSHQQLRLFGKAELNEANALRANLRKTIGVPHPYEGSKKGLVILVQFPNLNMAYYNINTIVTDMFNKPNYRDNGHIGSVHDYFLEQSYGKFDLSFDVVGPIMSKEDYGYYGRDSQTFGQDVNVRELVIEACQAADEYVNYGDYDWDGDGEVDQVFIIYAGYGQHSGAPANTIWPHESSLREGLILDGVQIKTYACSSELTGISGKTLNGIGVACHEFSHCLGIPDMYDTEYNGGFAMDYWDVMSSGSYSGPSRNAEVPYGYTAYERWFCGWLDFVEINESMRVETLPNLGESPLAYIVRNKGNENEYYILENHQADRWYSYLGSQQAGHGMLITHVDYDAKAWNRNIINTVPQHQRMTIIPADGKYDNTIQGLRGDTYPGTEGVTYFDNMTHEQSGGRLYNLNTDGTYNMNISLCNITETEGIISFDALMGTAAPIAMEPAQIDESGFWAEWTEVDGAESYTLEYTIVYSLFPPRLAKREITDVTDTRCFIPWEGQPISIMYKVKANRTDFDMPWSNTVTVNYEPGDGIVDVMTDEVLAECYTTIGMRSSKGQRGITILRNKNGETRKIFKK